MIKRTMQEEDVSNGRTEKENTKNNKVEENTSENIIWNIVRTDSIHYYSDSDEAETQNINDKNEVTKCVNKNTENIQDPIGFYLLSTEEENKKKEPMKTNGKTIDTQKCEELQRKMSTTIEENVESKIQNNERITKYEKPTKDTVHKAYEINNPLSEQPSENVMNYDQTNRERNTWVTTPSYRKNYQNYEAHFYNRMNKFEDPKWKQLQKFSEAEADVKSFREYNQKNQNTITKLVDEKQTEPSKSNEEIKSHCIIEIKDTNNESMDKEPNLHTLLNIETNNIKNDLSKLMQINLQKEEGQKRNTYPDNDNLQKFIKTSQNIRSRLEKIENEIKQQEMEHKKYKETCMKVIQKNHENKEKKVVCLNLHKYHLYHKTNNHLEHKNYKKENTTCNQIINHINENYCKRERMNTVLDSNNIHTLYKKLQEKNGNISKMLDILYDVDTKHKEDSTSNQKHRKHPLENIVYQRMNHISDENLHQRILEHKTDSGNHDRTWEQNYQRNQIHDRVQCCYKYRNQMFLNPNDRHYDMLTNYRNHVPHYNVRKTTEIERITRNEETDKKRIDDCVQIKLENSNNRYCNKNLPLYHVHHTKPTSDVNSRVLNNVEQTKSQNEIKVPKFNHMHTNESSNIGKTKESMPVIQAQLISEIQLQNIKNLYGKEASNKKDTEKQTYPENKQNPYTQIKKTNEMRNVTEQNNEYIKQITNTVYKHLFYPINLNLKEIQDTKRNTNQINYPIKEIENERNKKQETGNFNTNTNQQNLNSTFKDLTLKLLQAKIEQQLLSISNDQKLKNQHVKLVPPCTEQQNFLTLKRNLKNYQISNKENNLIDNSKNHKNNLQNNSMDGSNKSRKNRRNVNETYEETTFTKRQHKNIYGESSENLENPYGESGTERNVRSTEERLQKKNSMEDQPKESDNKTNTEVNDSLSTKVEKRMNPSEIINTANSLYDKMIKIFEADGLIGNKNSHELKEVHFKKGAVLKSKNRFKNERISINDNKRVEEKEIHTRLTNDTTTQNILENETNAQMCNNHINDSNKIQISNTNIHNKIDSRDVSRMSTKTSLVSKYTLSNKINLRKRNNQETKCKENHN